MPTLARKVLLALALMVARAHGQTAPIEAYDVWDLESGWSLSLYGSPKGDSFYPCELMHFDTERRIISVRIVEDPSWLSRGFVYLTIVDRDDKRVADTSVLIVMMDGRTVENLRPGMYPLPNEVHGEIFRLNEWRKVRGRKLQIITDHRRYEAPGDALPEAVDDLRACQRERDLRISGKWIEDDRPKFHR